MPAKKYRSLIAALFVALACAFDSTAAAQTSWTVAGAVVVNARNTTIQYNNPSASTTITNNQFNADGSLNTARPTPATAGAGVATGAQAMRSLQMQIRFTF